MKLLYKAFVASETAIDGLHGLESNDAILGWVTALNVGLKQAEVRPNGPVLKATRGSEAL